MDSDISIRKTQLKLFYGPLSSFSQVKREEQHEKEMKTSEKQSSDGGKESEGVESRATHCESLN